MTPSDVDSDTVPEGSSLPSPGLEDRPPEEYRGLKLDSFQAAAISHVKAGSSVLVSAPTGTGKTIIADYVVEQALLTHRQVIYTAPVKALSNQKYRDYTRLHGREKVGLITGDLVINQDAQIRIMTTEILRNILLQESCPTGLSHVIVDEVHFLDDEERGTVWEELLIYLPRSVKIVALSATLPNINDLAEWLEYVREESIPVVKAHRRTVPLKILLANREVGILEPREFEHRFHTREEAPRSRPGGPGRDRAFPHRELEPSPVQGTGRSGDRWAPRSGPPARGEFRPASRGEERFGGERFGRDRTAPGRFRRGDPRPESTSHLDLVEMARPDYLPVLYFVFSRRQTELFARELSRRQRAPFLSRADISRLESLLEDFDTLTPGVLSSEHRSMYLNGVAFHHAGLHVALKALVEELYEQRLISVLYCTSTFALGINMPARTVMFDALRKYNGTAVVPLTVRQFMQKAGRAGRRGMDRVGYVIIRQDYFDYPRERPQLDRYQRGEHEPIHSAFNLSFSSVVNLLFSRSDAEIRQVLDKSFLNFHLRREMERERGQLEALRKQLGSIYSGSHPGGREAFSQDQLKRMRKQANKMERQVAGQEFELYSKFTDKVDFLKAAGYLEDDGTFNAGARALMSIQISEIFVTELLLEGVFEELDDDELFGMLTGLVQELPRSVVLREPPRGKWARLRDRVRRVKDSEVVVRSSELLGMPVPFCPELMPFGEFWSKGRSLASLMLMLQSDIDVSGDLVGAFRRAKDLAGQLRNAYRGDPGMVDKLSRLIARVSRDEVEVID